MWTQTSKKSSSDASSLSALKYAFGTAVEMNVQFAHFDTETPYAFKSLQVPWHVDTVAILVQMGRLLLLDVSIVQSLSRLSCPLQLILLISPVTAPVRI